jgi:TonB-dependent starch-binding outer membrane protein SusC
VVNTNNRTTINNSNVLTFSNASFNSDFHKRNSVTLLAGQEIYQVRSDEYNIETRYFPLGISPERALGNLNLGDPTFGAQPKPTSEILPSNLLSFFSRLNYNLDNKYLVSLSVRADGSTKFATGNKWGYFPSGSFAWRLSNEKFMEGLSSAINDLKVRVSYGESGNNRIDDFLYLTQFTTGTQYGLNDQLVTGFAAPTLANENLTWETTISQNLGFDASVLNNRLSFSVDIYKNTTKDLLVNVPVPTTSGYTRQLQNVGSTLNKGVEVQVNGTPVSSKRFNWTANFNISFNKNTIRSLGQFQKSYLENSGWAGGNSPADFIVRVGESIGSIWGLETDGFYSVNDFDYNTATGVYTLKTGIPTNQPITAITPQPGGIKFKDIAGAPDASGKATPPDGKVDENDRTIIGNASPKFFGGLNQQFTFKSFDLNVFLNFQYGNDVYNANKLEFTSGYTPNSNLLAMMNNRWRTVDAQGNPLQRVVLVNNVQTVIGASPAALTAANPNPGLWLPITTSTSFVPHSWAIEDGSFIRLNNITLGYTLPASLTRKAKVERLRVYATASNLAIITNYSGYDPEVNTRRNNPVTPGVDYSAYPRSRSYVLGINLSL